MAWKVTHKTCFTCLVRSPCCGFYLGIAWQSLSVPLRVWDWLDGAPEVWICAKKKKIGDHSITDIIYHCNHQLALFPGSPPSVMIKRVRREGEPGTLLHVMLWNRCHGDIKYVSFDVTHVHCKVAMFSYHCWVFLRLSLCSLLESWLLAWVCFVRLV